jgi:hypothetical protein
MGVGRMTASAGGRLQTTRLLVALAGVCFAAACGDNEMDRAMVSVDAVEAESSALRAGQLASLPAPGRPTSALRCGQAPLQERSELLSRSV